MSQYLLLPKIKDDCGGYYLRGNNLAGLGRYEEAIASYERALEIRPDNLMSLYSKGFAQYKLSRYQEAIVSLNHALGIKPDFQEVLVLRGFVLKKLSRYEEAIADYTKAKEIICEFSYLPLLQELEANARNHLGAYYVSEGKWYEGLTQLQLSLDYYRQTEKLERRADLLAQIARVNLLLGDWDKARMLYRDALRLYVHLDKKDGIANCHLALGRMMLQLNYVEDAQKELETACNLFNQCGLSQRQAEAEEVLQVVFQFKSKQALT